MHILTLKKTEKNVITPPAGAIAAGGIKEEVSSGAGG